MVEVGHRRLHVAQCEVARLVDVEARLQPDVQRPVVDRCDVVHLDLAAIDPRLEALPHQVRRRTPGGGGQQHGLAGLDVGIGIARAGAAVGDDESELVHQELVVRPVGRPARAAVDGVHQVDVACAALAHAVDDRDRGPVDDTAQEHLRVQREAGPAVATYGPGVGRGGEHAAQAAATVVQRGGEQLGAEALALVPGQDGEGGQDPHQLTLPRDRAADDLAVHVGHPAAAGVGAQGVAGAGDPVGVTVRWPLHRVGPAAVEGADVDVVVGPGGDAGHRRQVGLGGRADERCGHDTWAAKRASSASQCVWFSRSSSEPSVQPPCSSRTTVAVPASSSSNVTTSVVGSVSPWPSQKSWT